MNKRQVPDPRISMRWQPIVLALTIVAGSCGDGDDDSAGITTGASPTSTSTLPSTTVATATTPGITNSPDELPPVGTDPPNDSESGGLDLPEGAEGPGNDRNRDVYGALRDGNCAQAQDNLDDNWHIDNEEQHPIQSPRDVLIFQAAIDLCNGRREQARVWLDDATRLGLQGLDAEVETSDDDVRFFPWYCEVYRSLISALDGVSRQSVTCPGGEPPGWPDGKRDDPRTLENEATSTTLDEQDDDSAASTEPTTVDTTGPTTDSSVPETSD